MSNEATTLDRFVEDLTQEARTITDRIRDIILQYRHRSPRIHENYTLVTLLYLRDHYLGEGGTLEDLLTRAARWELPSTTSIHRLMTEVKKEFDTPQQAEEAMRRKEAWRQAMKKT